MIAIKTNGIALFFFIGFATFAQTEEVVISFDPERNDFSIDRAAYNKLKNKDFFVLKIENLNTYLYEVEIGNKDVDTSEKLPSSLIPFFDISGLSGAVANLNSVSSIVRLLPKVDTSASSYKNFLQEDGKLSNIDEIEDRIKTHETYVANIFESLFEKQERINTIYIEAQDIQNNFLLIEKTKEVDSINVNSAGILQSFKDTKSDLLELYKEFLENKANFEGLIAANSKTIEAKGNESINTRVKQLTTIYATLTTAITETQALLTAEKYTTLSQGLITLENHKKFEYVSLPIQRYQEINEVTITIKPRGENDRLNTYTTTLRIPDYEKSFWGVSTGIFIAKNLEQNYSILERLDDAGATVYDLVEEDQSKQEIGFNTMVRYGCNLGGMKIPKLFWQFGFGGGITINEKIRPRILGGTGIAYGEKNKLVLDVGGIYMFYNKLSNVYQLEGNDTQPTDFMVGATQLRGYISLGYIIQLD
ncbi:MAG: hypothetical protein CL524_03380 [Aequorivita sp.]|nr:hypothetical protein [Aequorivita sp.]MBF32390.1 hypothetical protein [Aequorivita sp.]|tara:strand:- start:16800 stop:18230 length:1431 start_codon:yes stop_codon:yes gene_type:complete